MGAAVQHSNSIINRNHHSFQWAMDYSQALLLLLFFAPTNSFQPARISRTSSRLSYYKPNLPLSSRLAEIKSELTTLQKGGIDKFLLDEIASAQKRLSSDASDAERMADAIVKRGRGEEGKLMRDAAKDGANAVLNGLRGVRQELEEARGVKELGGVLEETVKNDLLLESGETSFLLVWSDTFCWQSHLIFWLNLTHNIGETIRFANCHF